MVLDQHQRPLRNLRLSVTDRCNLRCAYCMPEKDYAWLPHDDILRFEEIERVVDAFLMLGVDKVRLTGGEPLLRRDLSVLIAKLASRPAIADLALTTNGVLLENAARELRDAGLHRITVSLDTLQPERFKTLTRSDDLHRVLRGIETAASVFSDVKIDTVALRGTNDDEILDILDYGRAHRAEVRFIEYMDVGGATRWSMDHVISRDDILSLIGAGRGTPAPVDEVSSAPATRYVLPDGTVFGIIASTTAPFCADCDRSRLTADGTWLTCLYAHAGLDLRQPLRDGASTAALASLVTERWLARRDRGAEDRLSARDRSPFVPLASLKRDPHLEMHTRGG